MTNHYDEKEVKELNKISDLLVKLDETCSKIGEKDAEGKTHHFIEHEKALHEVRKIIRKCAKVDKLAGDSEKENLENIDIDQNLEGENIKSIAKTIDRLDKTIDKLDSGKEGKIKSYFEQKKALHEIKKVLHKEGLYAEYKEDELSNIDELNK